MIEPAHISREVKSEHSIIVHIRDTLGYVDGLMLSLSPNSTIRDIKGLILKHTDQLSRYLILSCEGYSSLEDHKKLQDYGVRDGSTISVFTEFEIYLNYNAPERTRVSVTVNTSARIQVIRLLALEKASRNTGFNPFEQVMTCVGQVLDDYELLGFHSQIVPGCEICFNKPNSK
jgi:hypothetical protein